MTPEMILTLDTITLLREAYDKIASRTIHPDAECLRGAYGRLDDAFEFVIKAEVRYLTALQ